MKTFASPCTAPFGFFCLPVAGTIAASNCISPSILMPASAKRGFASSTAFWTFSTSGPPAEPFVENERYATRGSLPVRSRYVCAVARPMSTSCSAVGSGITAQSPNASTSSPDAVGVLRSRMKQLDAVLTPFCVPSVWKAARSMSPVEAIEPATRPLTRPSFTIMPPK